uniref:Uncharacterized protein n=1 Tax=Hippocampus comes TaxID=109280 RepID=A0A3Q2YLJ5_HIPCM
MESLKSKGLAWKEEQPLRLLSIFFHLFNTFHIIHFLTLILSFPSAILPTGKDSSETLESVEETDGFHVKARQFHYPNSKVTRFPVPEEKVPWEVFSIYISPSDPHCTASNFTHSFFFFLGQNPGGRTGIRGRGSLSHLGPNLQVDLVITRWVYFKKNNRTVLSICAYNNQRAYSISSFSSLRDSGRSVFEGYVDDVRNTDNAWIETTVLNLHLDSSEDSEDIVNMVRAAIKHFYEVCHQAIT